VSGRGSFYKRDGRWAFHVSWRDVDGKRRQAKRQGFPTRKDAEKAATALLATIDTGGTGSAAKGTTADYLMLWLDNYSRSGRVRPTTVVTVRSHIEAYIVPRIGDLPLRRVTTATVNKLAADLLANGKTGYGKSAAPRGGLAPKTVRSIIGTLHKAFQDGVKWGQLPTNPADNADLPAWTRPDLQVWEPDQVGQFLRVAEEHADPMLEVWVFMFVTALRRGELLGLRWDDIDPATRQVTIRQTRVMVNGHPAVSIPKTDRGRRTFTVDADTIAMLEGVRRRQEATTRALGATPSGYVFTEPDGTPIHPQVLTRRYKAAARLAGIPVARVHDGRHTAITIQLAAGLPIHVVSARAGHSRVAFTLDTYGHALPAADRDAADQHGSLIHGLR
jgi:integrase